MEHVEEPRVTWPDPFKPLFTTRALTLTRSKREPLAIEGIKLIVLVNKCLYLVPEDGYGLKAGQVLARNLDLTERRGGSREQPGTEQFVAFESLFTARRGVSKIDPGQGVETVDLEAWLKDLDWMVRTSWTLHLADEEGEGQYVWRAEQAASARARVRNEHKSSAQGRTVQAASVKDSRGRKNPGRIPLICFAGERELHRRIRQIRGIGHRMSWRQVVLEHYIDRLREVIQQISRDAHYRIGSPLLFGDKRTRRTVLTQADQMDFEAGRIQAVVGRPFSRTFVHVAEDLCATAIQFRDAAKELSGEIMESAQATLRKIYRSVRMLEFHWRLEELLLQASDFKASGKELEQSQKTAWHNELRRVHWLLTRPDPFTGERWEEGFQRRVLPHVVPQIHLADVHLMQTVEDGGPDFEGMYDRLREACAPL